MGRWYSPTGPGGECTLCPINAYCPRNATNYTACTPHAHSVSGQQYNYCYCDAGYYGNAMQGDNCTLCPPNFYCSVSSPMRPPAACLWPNGGASVGTGW